MDVYIIWVSDKHAILDGVFWIETAWDEYTIEENGEGWDEARNKAYAQFGADYVRISKSTLDHEAIASLFTDTPSIGVQ